jgi:heterodisulfide reductase subunit A-like polyferredoxin
MRIDIKQAKSIKKPYYHAWALTYYLMVKYFGKKYFNYSDAYKTLADI